MSVTPNFSWPLIEPTDFVTNLPADLELLADDIDADVWAIKGTADAALPETIIDAAGDLIYGSAADTAARLPIGTAGQVLKVNSGATAPEWGIAGGGMTQIATGTLSGAGTTISSIAGTYKELWIYLNAIDLATDDVRTEMQFNGDTTSQYAFSTLNTGNMPIDAGNYIEILRASDNTVTTNFAFVRLPNYAKTTTFKFADVFSIGADKTTTTTLIVNRAFGVWSDLAAINAIKFQPGSGNFDGGSYEIYGVN